MWWDCCNHSSCNKDRDNPWPMAFLRQPPERVVSDNFDRNGALLVAHLHFFSNFYFIKFQTWVGSQGVAKSQFKNRNFLPTNCAFYQILDEIIGKLAFLQVDWAFNCAHHANENPSTQPIWKTACNAGGYRMNRIVGFDHNASELKKWEKITIFL